MRSRPRGPFVALLVVLATSVAGCGGSAGTGSVTGPLTRPGPPDLHGFLQLPVATPSSCPKTANGQTIGRRSPWAGHVDVSVFLARSASQRRRQQLAHLVSRNRLVAKVYQESQRQAFEEFQRLYTCWTSVSPSQTPASLRIVLVPTATIAGRDALVARLLREPVVDSISCDPVLPCTNVVHSPGSAPTSSS
jgi:hypothetical protein